MKIVLKLVLRSVTSVSEAGIYKSKQENKKKTKTQPRKRSRKRESFFFFLGRFLGRESVFFLFSLFSWSLSWSSSCFLIFFNFLVFFYKFPSLIYFFWKKLWQTDQKTNHSTNQQTDIRVQGKRKWRSCGVDLRELAGFFFQNEDRGNIAFFWSVFLKTT